jgi:hypothetical protein
MSGGSIEARDAALRFPSAVASWRGNFRIGVTTASQAIPIGEDMRGKFIRAAYVGAVGSDVQIAGGISSTVIVRNQVSTPLAPSAGAAPTLTPGDKLEGILDGDTTHLVLIGSAGGGFIEMFVSEV